MPLDKQHFLNLITPLLLSAALCLPLALSAQGETASGDNNPFFTPYNTPFDTPPFDRIQNAHFLPAVQEGIKRQQAEIDAIVVVSKPATFQNTIEAMDLSGQFLERVAFVFYSNLESITSKELQELAAQIAPLVSAHQDNILLNGKLFARVKAVHDRRARLKLAPAQLYLLENTYRQFVRNGALLDETQKVRLRDINRDLSLLALKFDDNLLAETNSSYIVIDDQDDLVGLPAGIVAAAAETAQAMNQPGKWVFTAQKPSWIPFLQYAEKRDLREKLYSCWFMRGDRDNDYDNKAVLQKIVDLRAERSKLLGYKNFAQFTLEERMAKTPEAVNSFLADLWTKALERAKGERDQMQQLIDAEQGNFQLASWDWWHYAEKLRKAKYDLDDSALRPYFELQHVRRGIFDLSNKLYGLTFTENKEIPVYHPEVSVYEVKEADGRLLGILYMDFFPRDSKRGGAWTGGFRGAWYDKGRRVPPLVTITCNFTKPSGDTPSLLSLDEVSTYFHEFGHALNALLADNRARTTFIPWDAVELPSQIMEHWVLEPEMLKLYARHYQTGEVIPAKLVEKLKKSSLFNQGFETVEFLAACILDMALHTLDGAADMNMTDFEKRTMSAIGLIPEILPRYRSTYFAHIVGGYAAGYYSYMWSEVLDCDAFEAFKETSLFDRETAAAFRKNVLEKLGTEDAMTLYKRFRGREPRIEPLLKKRGLL